MNRPSAAVREPSDSATAARILDSAIALFAARGFDEVTVRDIAEDAGANPAAISYYFGAKEQLIQHAIRSVIAPLNERRLAALAAVRERAAAGALALDDVVRAMVEPTVRACIGGAGSERHYARVLVLSFALRQPFVDEVMNQETDQVAERFVEALGEALPGSDRATLFWRFDFMIGALLHILLDASRSHRLRRISGGLCDTANADAITAQLVAFISTGLKAHAPS
jgi:AcrR family transcriptional regulator